LVLASAFVLSGPYLMLRGEEMQPRVPVLQVAHSKEKSSSTAAGKSASHHDEAELH